MRGERKRYNLLQLCGYSRKGPSLGVLPKAMDAQDEEELDRNKKLQRMNVAFSRGKEKLIFVHSKPVGEFSAGKEALLHYKSELSSAKLAPTEEDVDQNSEILKRRF